LEELRAVTTPKSKFAFKRRTANTHPQSAPSMSSPTPPEEPTSPLPPAPVLVSSPITSPTPSITLTSRSKEYLTLKSLPLPSFSPARQSDLTISDLDACVVNLLSGSWDGGEVIGMSALYIRNVSNSVLVMPLIQGSVIVHGLRRCVVVFGCHQVRIPPPPDF
jgi:tubulin-specific chaperone C